MSKPPDLETLARQYLELWQSQLTAMAADPDTAETMGRMMAAMAQANPAAMGPMGPAAMNPAAMAQAMWAGTSGQAGPPGEEHDAKAEQRGSGAAAGPAAATAASDDGDDVVARLERRVAELEERLDRLERQRSAPKGKSAKRTG